MLAWEATVYVDDHKSLSGVPTKALERLMCCGGCPHSTITKDQADSTLRSGMGEVRDTMSRLWFGDRPEKVWKPKPSNRVKSVDNQIERLKRKMEDYNAE